MSNLLHVILRMERLIALVQHAYMHVTQFVHVHVSFQTQ